jgi:hypothetical protein
MIHSVIMILVQLILAVAFYFFINWLGKHSEMEGYRPLSFFVQPDEAPAFNLIFRTLSPVVYIIIVAAVLYLLHLDWLVKNLYLVTIFYAIIRLLVNFLDGQIPLVDWRVRLTSWLSIPFSWFIYEHIIKTRQHLLPDLDKISDELWLGVLVFLYSAFNSIKVSTDRTESRLSRYIEASYSTFTRSYGTVISQKTEDQRMQALIYSIMIYENFNRPKLRRLSENVGFRLGKCKTLGVMQVTTGKLITDLESVEIGVNKILNDYNDAYGELKKRDDEAKEAADKNSEQYDASPSTNGLIRQTIRKYNPDDDYSAEVNSIYEKVIKSHYSSLVEKESDV